MIDVTSLREGSILVFKKPHPCKGYEWKVLRTGIDFKLECCTCKRQIIIPRIELGKRIKSIKAL